MQLHSREISPFAARVRVSILAKELPVQVIDSPDVSSQAYAALNPFRRVPVLVLDEGTAIPESDTIVEYLEDAYPERPLRPADPRGRAHVRLLARVAELYVFPAVVPIFGARGQEQADALFTALDGALGSLASLLDPHNASWHAWGNQLTTADGALAPFLFYVQIVGQAAKRAPLARHARLERFWEGAQEQPVLAKVTAQIGQAFRARRGA
ncbi:MAG TPA: glutathione S-transferase family protein [Polyangiales bacterium]